MKENLPNQPIERKEKSQELYALDETIKQGNSKVEISKTGGTILSWTVDGQEIIPKLFKKINQKTGKTSYRGGMPICFPFFGPSPEGMENIPQHGWLRNSKGSILKINDNQVSVAHENDPTEEYPWKLEVGFNCQITDNSLEITLAITRLSDGQQSPAPINPAFHPYFTINKNSQSKVDHQEINFSSKDYGLDITDDSNIIIDTKAGPVKMTTKGFSKLWVWSDNPEKYGCLEPVLDDPKKFNTEAGTFLDENNTLILEMKLTLQKNN